MESSGKSIVDLSGSVNPLKTNFLPAIASGPKGKYKKGNQHDLEPIILPVNSLGIKPGANKPLIILLLTCNAYICLIHNCGPE